MRDKAGISILPALCVSKFWSHLQAQLHSCYKGFRSGENNSLLHIKCLREGDVELHPISILQLTQTLITVVP